LCAAEILSTEFFPEKSHTRGCRFVQTMIESVLVTGASGFLGGRLVEMLLDAGTPVTVLARSGSKVPERPGVRVLRADLDAPGVSAEPIERTPELVAALADITHIFHCAGCSTDWARLAAYQQANITLTAAMLRLAQQHAPRLERFVHVSSTDVYGYPKQAGDERMPLRDVGLPYNRTKLLGDQLVQRAIKAREVKATIVRPASIYGPGGKAFVTDIVALLRQRLMLLVDGGRARGGFVYVDDVCRAMLLAAVSERALGQTYILSSVDGTSWRTYTRALAEMLQLPAPWLSLPFPAAMALARVSQVPHQLGLPGRPLLTRHAVYLLARDQQYGSAQAREELGWMPVTPLEDGIARSVVALAK
jgi:nucleoside-diphosphate-sugar epimerase